MRRYTGLLKFQNRFQLLRLILRLAAFFSLSIQVYAAEVSVAVAANFTAPMQKIAQAFEADHRLPIERKAEA